MPEGTDKSQEQVEGKSLIKVTLNDAIENAIKSETKQENKEPEEKKAPAEKKVEAKESDDKKDSSKEDEEAEKVEALHLFRSLKDPEQAKIIINHLYGQINPGEKPLETKKEVAEVKESIIDLLKESLGTEFDFLADKLAPALDKILKLKMDEQLKDFKTDRMERLEQQGNQALETVSKEYFGESFDKMDPKLAGKMSTLMNDIKPTQGENMLRYVRRVLFQAAGELDLPLSKFVEKSPKDKQKDEELDKRREKNRNDAPSRLASERGSGTSQEATIAGKKMSLDESIKDAVEKARAGTI